MFNSSTPAFQAGGPGAEPGRRSNTMSKRFYCVWMSNFTSREDDEPIKVRASSKDEARKIAADYQPHRFGIRHVYTLGEFRKATGWPHTWATKFRC